MDDFRKKIIGSWFGMAVGDAMGRPAKGLKPAAIRQIFGAMDGFKDVRSIMGKGIKDYRMQGLYGVNPTIQQVLSIPGHPLHLHGYEVNENRGGHINQAFSTSTTQVTVYPIRDINISIKGLDKALLPVKPLQ